MNPIVEDARRQARFLYGSDDADNVIKVLVDVIERLAMATSPGYIRAQPARPVALDLDNRRPL